MRAIAFSQAKTLLYLLLGNLSDNFQKPLDSAGVKKFLAAQPSGSPLLLLIEVE
jgi:hypothetical protein